MRGGHLRPIASLTFGRLVFDLSVIEKNGISNAGLEVSQERDKKPLVKVNRALCLQSLTPNVEKPMLSSDRLLLQIKEGEDDIWFVTESVYVSSSGFIIH